MSLVQTFVDAFKKAAGRNPKAEVDVKSVGPMGSTAGANAGAFDPLRPSGDPEEGGEIGAPRVDRPDAGQRPAGARSSADPEEGGEIGGAPIVDRPDAGQRPGP
jgi:hypothetical protein